MPVMQIRRVGMFVAHWRMLVGMPVWFTRRIIRCMRMLVVQLVSVFMVVHKR